MDTGSPDIPGFKLKTVTNLKLHAERFDGFLGESDLSLQTGDYLLQYEYHKVENQKSLIIKPGTYNLSKGLTGLDLVPMEFMNRELLTSVTNTALILTEAEIFFNSLDIYTELKQPKKRGIILYGQPGCGKSVAIIQAAKDLYTRDPGTVVINWPTSEIEAGNVFKFFTNYSEYEPICTKVILIVEDLGGSAHEGHSRRDEVSSSLLNLLDGINNVFKLPTLILSTTNFPENLMKNLSDRPGRFDMMLEINPPKYDERVALVEFIAKRPLSMDEKESLKDNINKGTAQFSIAHLQEIVIRSRLHKKSIDTVVKELIEHTQKFKIDFSQPKKKTGFSFMDIDDD